MKIDFHLHMLATQKDFLDQTLRRMDAAGVEMTVLQAMFPFEYAGHTCGGNDEVLEAIRAHPDRLVGSIYVDPREPDSTQTVRRYANEGFRCVKMWPPIGFYPDDERFYPVFELIESLGLPLLLHAGLTGSGTTTASKYADPVRMEGLVRRFPNLSFVLAHWGGLGFVHQAWAIASRHGNVYLDAAEGRCWGWPGVEYFKLLQPLYPLDFNRIVWGTDNIAAPAEDIAAYQQILKDIDRAAFADRFFGETARSLLRLA